ncbi:MAG TPA: PA2779 family protein [Nitrospiria bacterium]|nr:PA2779 family protein [Nitrospiria bacterium]
MTRSYIFKKSLMVYLALAIFFVSFPSDLYAMFLSSQETVAGNSETVNRDKDIQTVQKTLESKIVRQRLADLGLTADQVSSRLAQLSDQDLHSISSKIDQMQTGGGDDGLGLIVVLLVVAILVVVLLQVSGHRVIVTR